MSFLGVIVDCNACNWGSFLDKQIDKSKSFQNLLSAILSFCNAHLITSLNNQLLVVAGGINDRDKKLFSSGTKSTENQLGEIESRIREALIKSAHENKNALIMSNYAAAVSLTICGKKFIFKESLLLGYF